MNGGRAVNLDPAAAGFFIKESLQGANAMPEHRQLTAAARAYFDRAGLVACLAGSGVTLTGIVSVWIGFALLFFALGVILSDLLSLRIASCHLRPWTRLTILLLLLGTTMASAWRPMRVYADSKSQTPLSLKEIRQAMKESLSEVLGQSVDKSRRGATGLETVPGLPSEPKDEPPDAGIEIVNPRSPAVLIYNRAKSLLRDPRYVLYIWDLDAALKEGVRSSLLTFTPNFKDQWLRRANGFGPWPFFETHPVPPVGHRLFGYVNATCPDCVTERTYWVYTVYGKDGWYGELPPARRFDSRMVAAVLDRAPDQQAEVLKRLPIVRRLPISPAY
jgi:hypothetical protein